MSSNRNGPCQIFWQGLDEIEPTLLVGGEHDLVPGSWLPDGERLLFTEYNPVTGAGVWSCAPTSGEAPHPVVRSRANTFAPVVAPGGLAFAFTSDESGRMEIYVASLRDPGDAARARSELGWEPSIGFTDLIELMVDADLARLDPGRTHDPARDWPREQAPLP